MITLIAIIPLLISCVIGSYFNFPLNICFGITGGLISVRLAKYLAEWRP